MDAKEQLPYAAPEWAEGMDAPAAKLRLGLFPTPVQRLNLGAFGAAEGLNVFIKRDGAPRRHRSEGRASRARPQKHSRRARAPIDRQT